MENLIYNDLICRGYSVDVGIVELTCAIDDKRKLSQYEIGFVVNAGNNKVYIQSALNVDTPEKKTQETFSLRNTDYSFRKLLPPICKPPRSPMHTLQQLALFINHSQ